MYDESSISRHYEIPNRKKVSAHLVDKTGTFTLGSPKVVEVIPFAGYHEENVVLLVATGEKFSEHLLARTILAEAKDRNITVPDPDEFKSETGMGSLHGSMNRI